MNPFRNTIYISLIQGVDSKGYPTLQVETTGLQCKKVTETLFGVTRDRQKEKAASASVIRKTRPDQPETRRNNIYRPDTFTLLSHPVTQECNSLILNNLSNSYINPELKTFLELLSNDYEGSLSPSVRSFLLSFLSRSTCTIFSSPFF